jgi:hypothetical protein
VPGAAAICPQWGHFPFRPAWSSGTVKLPPQLGQLNSIISDPLSTGLAFSANRQTPDGLAAALRMTIDRIIQRRPAKSKTAKETETASTTEITENNTAVDWLTG